MNEPTEVKRMTSLDRRIDASKRRGEEERKQHLRRAEPMGGLTSIASTAGCNIANDPLKPKPVGDIDIPIICAEQLESLTAEMVVEIIQAQLNRPWLLADPNWQPCGLTRISTDDSIELPPYLGQNSTTP